MPNTTCHIELSTDAPKDAKKFYGKLFDWKLTVDKQMNYTMIDMGTKASGGGIGPRMAPDQPTAWMPYIQVDSVKKSIAKAKKLGADIKLEYMAIGAMGAIGVFVDPFGAALGVWEAAAKPAKKAARKKAGKKK